MTTGQTPSEVLAGFFPDSAEAVALVSKAIAISGQPVAEGDDDARTDAIREMLGAATPAVRTRVVVISEVLRELAGVVRMLAIEAKNDQGDPDISEGHAEVTEDGWLIVSMGDKEIGRVPFNPRRRDGTESKLASDILAEYVRLHGLGKLDADSVTKLPVAGRRNIVAVVHDEPEPDPAP